jgi:hypothetical protein
MTARSVDELLDGLKHRDFLVLTMHRAGLSPRALRSLWTLRRGPFYVGQAEARLIARGLLDLNGEGPRVTRGGERALKTGYAVLELDSFEP